MSKVSLHGQLNPWAPADLEKIHQAALVILEKTGVSVDHEAILDRLEATDAKVDRDRRIVRFPAHMVQKAIENSPGSWDRNSSGNGSFTVSVDCGAYFAWDYATRASRPATLRDLIDVPRLVEALPHIGEAGNLIYLSELPAPVRDMIVYRHMWNHTQKKGGGGLGRCPSCCHALSVRSFDYLCRMLSVKIGPEKMRQESEFSFFMGVASPLRWGHDVLEMAKYAIEQGQAVGIGGNCICGIQSPITPASNIALDHAERLSGLCILTAIKPDAKFYFTNHTYLLDMQSGDIGSGSPEQTLLALLGKKVLEHCGFQLRVNHPILDTGSHIPDAQAAAEKAMYMLLTALGGAKGIGGAGQLKEIFCYEQLVIDHEIAGYIRHLLKGAAITDSTISLDAILERGIGGNFLDSDATLAFLRECYYSPTLFYRKRMSEWVREGSKDTLIRAHEKVQTILASETPTFLTPEQRKAMDEIIREACAELTPGFDPIPYLRE